MAMERKKITASASAAPFCGSGKLTDYTKEGSWIMNQIEKGYDKTDRGVKIVDDGGNIRFAKDRTKRIASIITASSEDFSIRKDFRPCQSNGIYEYCYAVRWMMSCEMINVTLSELCAMKELLNTIVGIDQMKIQQIPDFEATNFSFTDAAIDARNSCLKIECVIRIPASVVVDKERINRVLAEMGFCAPASPSEPGNDQPRA